MNINEIKNQAEALSFVANSDEVKHLARLVALLCEEVDDMRFDPDHPEDRIEHEFGVLLAKAKEEMGEKSEGVFGLQDLARLARQAGVFEREVGTQVDGRRLTYKEERAEGEDRGYMYQAQISAFEKRMQREIGTQREGNGVRVIFGKRAEMRKASYTLTVLPVSSPNDPALATRGLESASENHAGDGQPSGLPAAPCSDSSSLPLLKEECCISASGEAKEAFTIGMLKKRITMIPESWDDRYLTMQEIWNDDEYMRHLIPPERYIEKGTVCGLGFFAHGGGIKQGFLTVRILESNETDALLSSSQSI